MTSEGEIFHRASTRSGTPWVMIETEFDAPPARLHAVVTDYNHFADFIPHVAESRVLLEEGERRWVYHHLVFPGPVADRAYVMTSTSAGSRPEEDIYRVTWEIAGRKFTTANLAAGIQPETLSGYWEISPAHTPGKTRARYAIVSDPGGLLPHWLVSHQTDRYVQQVIGAVRERLATTNEVRHR